MESPADYDLIILGGGVCGLAAAYEALKQQPSLRVLLIEKESTLGGLARSLQLGQQRADFGPHRLHTEIPEVRKFLLRYAQKELESVKRKSAMLLRGEWIDYPPKPLEILRVLGPVAVARVFLRFGLETLGRLLNPGSAKRQPDNFETVMAAAFGTELYRLIVLDYTRKVWKLNPKRIHGDIARVRVSAGGLQRMVKRLFVKEKAGQETALPQFLYLPGGVETLIHKLAADTERMGLSTQLNAAVAGLERTGGSWSVQLDSGENYTAQRVLSTIPVTELGQLLLSKTPSSRVAKALSDARFIANFLVALRVKRDRITENQWLYFPGKETLFNRGYEPKNFSESMGAPGETLILFEVTCYEGDRIWQMTDEELVRRTLKDCQRIGLVSPMEVQETLVFRIPQTYPLYDLGYRERMQSVWNYLSDFPGLLSTGRQGLFLHNNMDHSIFMGFEAARWLQKNSPEQKTDSWYRRVSEFQAFRIVD